MNISILLLIALPIAVVLGGGQLMNKISGRFKVACQTPLFLRWKYKESDVKDYWGALKKINTNALENEKRFLKLDLFFPFFYGGAFVISLTALWLMLDKPIALIWLITPAVVAMVADWTENLIQLRQIQLFIDGASLQADRIQISSIATAFKILFIVLSMLLLSGLSFCLLMR